MAKQTNKKQGDEISGFFSESSSQLTKVSFFNSCLRFYSTGSLLAVHMLLPYFQDQRLRLKEPSHP